MRFRGAFSMIAMTALSSPAFAERDLMPSLDNKPDICADRPVEPEWMQNIGTREAYKRVLVHDIYRAQNRERIITSNSCACETRFPPWATAVAEFRERFSTAERWEMLEASDMYNQRANALRSEVKTICEATKNW
jgi:hypothetical protein